MRSVFRGERERGWARWFSTAVQGGGLKKILLRDGATMCAEVHGPEKSGSKMVLLNGWTLGKRDWHPNFFAGSANRTVVAVDNRGRFALMNCEETRHDHGFVLQVWAKAIAMEHLIQWIWSWKIQSSCFKRWAQNLSTYWALLWEEWRVSD